jgi:hypothetical protein
MYYIVQHMYRMLIYTYILLIIALIDSYDYHESHGAAGSDLRAGVNPSLEPAGKPSLVCTPRRSLPAAPFHAY